jgi:DNA-binding beta-propeller fold protein YncE
MRKQLTYIICFSVCAALIFQACDKTDPAPVRTGHSGYPLEIENIIVKKCATSGCHNSKSAAASSGLDLTTWDNMFKGNRAGAVVIPYWHDLSSMFAFVNTHADLGAMAVPTMPLGADPLTKGEVTLIRNWIDRGAPNIAGIIKFADDPQRGKYYVPNQGCDLVAVIDRASDLQMRYVQVGHTASAESPHRVLVSPDKQYWYVCFIASDVIQKYRASDDTFVDEAVIGYGSWNTFAITPDGKHAFVDDFATGDIAYVDLENMTMLFKYSNYTFPHGTMMTDANTLYILDAPGSRLFILDVTDPTAEVATTINLPSGTTPHEIILSHDGTQYYITAQGRNEIQVYNKATNAFIKSIPTGTFPQEMAISKTKNLLFVTCMEDVTTFPGKRGSVAIIDCNTNTFVKSVFTGFQPHGVAVDDAKGFAVVTNRNISVDAPAPHHAAYCSGKNGSLSYINLNTLEAEPARDLELSVDPYSVEIR